MLSCKDYVNETSKILDNEKLPVLKKLNILVHQMICHHCRKYLNQMKTTVEVANKLNHKTVSEKTKEVAVKNLKAYSDKQ